AAATKVGRSSFGDQYFGRESQNLVDGQRSFCGDFVALPRQGAGYCVERLLAEIENQDTHQVFDARRESADAVEPEEPAAGKLRVRPWGRVRTVESIP